MASLILGVGVLTYERIRISRQKKKAARQAAEETRMASQSPSQRWKPDTASRDHGDRNSCDDPPPPYQPRSKDNNGRHAVFAA